MTDTIMQLPFSEDGQDAVIGHLIDNTSFFLQCKGKIKPTWFLSRMNGKVYDLLIKFSEKYNRHCTRPEIFEFQEFLLEKEDTQKKIRQHIDECLRKSDLYGLDIIRKDLTEWMHSVLFQQSVEGAVHLFNNRKFKESYQHVTNLVQNIRDTSFEEGKEVDFSNFQNYLAEDEKLSEVAYTTGLTLLDRALLDGQGGGLLPGDFTVVLAPANVGKTSTIVTMVVHNIKQKKNCLLLVHEGTQRDIRQKILRSYLGLSLNGLFQMYKTKDGQNAIQASIKDIDKYLTYVHYVKPGMVVEDVEPIIRKHKEKLAHRGEKLHLLFCDYPGLLSTSQNSKGNMAERHLLHYVYRYLSQVCAELDIHGIVAAQTNREGSKIARGADDRLLGMEDTGESWGIPQIATNMISLNRHTDGPFQHIMTFYVCKSRSSRVGTAVAAKTDFASCRTHSDDLGACSYFGSVSMADKIDSYLQNEQLRNKQLPNNAVYYSKDILHA